MNNLRIFGSVMEDLGMCAMVCVKGGVYKVSGMDFRCGEDPYGFKNTFDHFDGQNHQFSHYYSIFASK